MSGSQPTALLTLLKPSTIAAYTAAGFWGDETIYHLAARQARVMPQDFAVRDRHRRLSYMELVAAAERLAAHLAGRGIRPGNRVAVWLPSRVEIAIALLACSRNGYVCCPSLHRDHTVGEVVALTERMRAAALIAQSGYCADAARRDVFTELADRDFLRCAWPVGPADAVPFGELPDPALEIEASGDANQVMYLPSTSGTTGEPKGVMHSDNTLLATARMMARDWRLKRAVLYTLNPCSHNLGLGALITALASGGELVVHDLPRGASLLDRLEETRTEFLFGVPTHAIDLLTEVRVRGVERLGAVRGFRISGSAAPVPVVAELMQYGIVPQSGYGMTETCSHQYTLPDDPEERILETCGRACAGYEIRVWRHDDPDTEAASGEIGEVGGRGASLMLGYFDDQRATEAAFNAQGWFMTGDLGWTDGAGYLRIVGRKKEVIIRGGRNIHPARIEALALRHMPSKRRRHSRLATRGSVNACAWPSWRGAACSSNRRRSSNIWMPLACRNTTCRNSSCHCRRCRLPPAARVLKRELVQKVAEGQLRPLPVRFPSSSGPPERLRVGEVAEPKAGAG
jgi:acyl-CoA synthetase